MRLPTCPPRAGEGRRSPRPSLYPCLCFSLFFCLLLGLPAAAELTVRLSRPAVGRFESVGITVTDPIGGLDANPGPLKVTMADSRDWRQTLYLEPTSRSGEWSGRFTPVRTGRYTGTAVLERGDEREIGLVPTLRVRGSSRSGFLRLHPRSRRSFQFSNGSAFFPVGVRLQREDLRPGVDWRGEFARLRAAGVNYLEIPVAWPDTQSDVQREQAGRVIDSLLLEAERTGRTGVQLRLEGPPDADGDGALAYGEQLQRWVRRWSYSPAVAVWHLAGVTEGTSAEFTAGLARAVRNADSYGHLIALPGSARGGADLAVLPANWQRPGMQLALMEFRSGSTADPQPLPGENTWQMLAVGGVGLPLVDYRVGDAASAERLRGLGRLAGAARSIPFHAGGVPVAGLVPSDSPGSFYRYGKTLVGWLAPEPGAAVLRLRTLPRGRYRAQLWNPATNAQLSAPLIWSDGRGAEVPLPAGMQAVYVQVDPIVGGAPAARPVKKPVSRPAAVAASTRKPVKPAARKTSPKKTVKKAAPAPKPKRLTAKQRREQERAAKRRAAAEKAAAKKAAAKKAAAKRAAAKKAKKPSTAKSGRRASKTPPKSAKKKPATTKSSRTKKIAKPAKKPVKKAAKKPAKKAPVKKPVKKAVRKRGR